MTLPAARTEWSHPSAAHAALRRHGRSFHFASRLLGRDQADRAARLYAFCRALDDIADARADRSEDLADVKAMLAGQASVRHAPTADFLRLAEQTGMAFDPAYALIDGLIFDQGEVALCGTDELVRYAYQVAGTVGLMMCAVLECDTEPARAFAIDLGIAMQLSNIARDVAEDAAMGRRYLPAEWIGERDPADILAALDGSGPGLREVRTARDLAVALAETYYDSAIDGLAYLPARARFAILAAALVYRRIGRQAHKAGAAGLTGRQVVTGPVKIAVVVGGVLRHAPSPRFWTPPVRHDRRLHAPIAGWYGADRDA